MIFSVICLYNREEIKTFVIEFHVCNGEQENTAMSLQVAMMNNKLTKSKWKWHSARS